MKINKHLKNQELFEKLCSKNLERLQMNDETMNKASTKQWKLIVTLIFPKKWRTDH